jgi:hypothetical protein
VEVEKFQVEQQQKALDMTCHKSSAALLKLYQFNSFAGRSNRISDIIL